MGADSAGPPAVLIADDQEAICFALSREVRRRGMTALVAADGLDAVRLCRGRRGAVDVAFLDLRMPRLGGMDALALLRGQAPRLRCCLMTAYPGDLAPLAGTAGAEELLTKPFDLDDFVRVLDRLLAGAGASPQRGESPGASSKKEFFDVF